jgi:NADP-dependent 3-hydroxy acid dehydrogenase YdfG
MVCLVTGGSGTTLYAKTCISVLTGSPGIGDMFAENFNVNSAAKVYMLGRRLDKLEEVIAAAVQLHTTLDAIITKLLLGRIN